jgi:hypothetical protein
MRYYHEKGKLVKPTEHDAKSASTPKTGFFAVLRGRLRVKGSGAPVRCLAAVLVVAVAVSVGVLLLAAPASDLAATTCAPPTLGSQVYHQVVHATRAVVEVNEHTGGCEFEVKAEYATSESGPWTLANEETRAQIGESGVVQIGLLGSPLGHNSDTFVLHHLVPDTPYFARFVVKDHEGEASKTFAFTTTPITKPEIALEASGETHPSFVLVQGTEPSQTSAGFTADIEGNGAATEYRFEYKTTGGSWGPFTSAGSGSISVAEGFVEPEAKLEKLTPETTYDVRLRASNEKGEVEQSKFQEDEQSSFTTRTARPVISGTPEVRNVTGSAAHLTDGFEPNGSEADWQFEYASSAGGPWSAVPGAAGTVSQAQAEALGERGSVSVEGALTGLSPAKEYFVRLSAHNRAGEGEDCYFVDNASQICNPIESASFETSGPPTADTFATHALHGESVRLLGAVDPASVPTSAEQTITIGGSPTGGTFTLTFKGQSVADTGTGDLHEGSDEITGLVATTGAFGTGETIEGAGIPPGTTITHALQGGGVLQLSADATASGTGVALTVTLPKLSFNANASEIGYALEDISSIGSNGVSVDGPDGGPYRVSFEGSNREMSEPLIEANDSGLTPSGSVTVATVQAGGVGYETHYHFEYLTEAQFNGEGGFSSPETKSTPAVDLGSGDTTESVGQDLPALKAGETYRYRLVATNDSPSDPVVVGAEHTFRAPAPAPVRASEYCPNEQYRTGPGADLPDCRTYEQLTPLNKEGAEEIFGYGENIPRGAVASDDGDGVVYEDEGTVNWDPSGGGGPYFFSRQEGEGWQVTAGGAQPGTGLSRLEPELYDAANLSRFAFKSGYVTGPTGESPEVQFGTGASGGPYTTVASVPRAQVGNEGKWVAASADFSKLVLKVEDHKLLGSSTGTLSGYDLYEYSGGELRQVNVEGGGRKLGTCGAKIAKGDEAVGGSSLSAGVVPSSPRAVSADGSRVFFEAVPGSNCSAPENLYVRENGESTLDIGAYQFLAANSEGSEVLLGKRNGGTLEVSVYDTQTQAVSPLFSFPNELNGDSHISVSEDLDAIYFETATQMPGTEAPPIDGHLGLNAVQNIYRYDVPTRTLSFVVQAANAKDEQVTPDGRYDYFQAEAVGAVPGGRVDEAEKTTGNDAQAQVYRYDSAEGLVQCMSCASPFDPEPALDSYFGPATDPGRTVATDAAPVSTLVAGDGDFAFFYTASALLPADVDGEIAPSTGSVNSEFESFTYSPSTDVYEWRKDGVDGCGQLQGCLALITTGHGGYLNLLIGSAEEGRDVFFTSTSQLVPQDDDSTLNIYDARIDGGLPGPPPRPVECEGDACSTPLAAPVDSTPASLSFSGAGNLPPVVAPAPKATTKATKKTTKKKKKRKTKVKQRKGKAKAKKQARKAGDERRAKR